MPSGKKTTRNEVFAVADELALVAGSLAAVNMTDIEHRVRATKLTVTRFSRNWLVSRQGIAGSMPPGLWTVTRRALGEAWVRAAIEGSVDHPARRSLAGKHSGGDRRKAEKVVSRDDAALLVMSPFSPKRKGEVPQSPKAEKTSRHLKSARPLAAAVRTGPHDPTGAGPVAALSSSSSAARRRSVVFDDLVSLRRRSGIILRKVGYPLRRGEILQALFPTAKKIRDYDSRKLAQILIGHGFVSAPTKKIWFAGEKAPPRPSFRKGYQHVGTELSKIVMEGKIYNPRVFELLRKSKVPLSRTRILTKLKVPVELDEAWLVQVLNRERRMNPELKHKNDKYWFGK